MSSSNLFPLATYNEISHNLEMYQRIKVARWNDEQIKHNL